MGGSSRPALPELGVGIVYSSGLEPLLRRYPELIDVLEVEPQTTWIETQDPSGPYLVRADLLQHIAALPGRKLVHSVGTPADRHGHGHYLFRLRLPPDAHRPVRPLAGPVALTAFMIGSTLGVVAEHHKWNITIGDSADDRPASTGPKPAPGDVE